MREVIIELLSGSSVCNPSVRLMAIMAPQQPDRSTIRCLAQVARDAIDDLLTIIGVTDPSGGDQRFDPTQVESSGT